MKTNLLIIGAGPFGLSLAAYVKHLGIDYLQVGKPMEFWKNNMPDGMFLRSTSDWSLCPLDKASIVQYLETLGKTPKDVEPLSRDFYLDYSQWFQKQHKLDFIQHYVTKLDRVNDGFEVTLDNGDVIEAKNVVVAIGMGYFKNMPQELTDLLPQGRYKHTVDAVRFDSLKGSRVLIFGGRQSAYEWTALLNDLGVGEVHLVHRHESPKFETSDWEWVPPMVDGMVNNPGWFRNLDQDEKDEINKHLWSEGRLKLEPWLADRVMKENTHIHASTTLRSSSERTDGTLGITLKNGDSFVVDDVILATGYKVEISNIPFLGQGSLAKELEVKNGFPALDESFQTNIKGLYITSMPAGQDFGPFFGFTVSVRSSAKIIGNALVKVR